MHPRYLNIMNGNMGAWANWRKEDWKKNCSQICLWSRVLIPCMSQFWNVTVHHRHPVHAWTAKPDHYSTPTSRAWQWTDESVTCWLSSLNFCCVLSSVVLLSLCWDSNNFNFLVSDFITAFLSFSSPEKEGDKVTCEKTAQGLSCNFLNLRNNVTHWFKITRFRTGSSCCTFWRIPQLPRSDGRGTAWWALYWDNSEPPGVSLGGLCLFRAVQQNLRAQGSVTRQQVANFSLPPRLFNQIIFQRIHRSNLHIQTRKCYLIITLPSRSDHFSTSVEVQISERDKI